MELFIAILMYLGMLSPNSVGNASTADLNAMVNCNQSIINQVMQDPTTVQAAGDLIIDRRED